jgi:5-methylcytosine-specific restriction endonuclease McrA
MNYEEKMRIKTYLKTNDIKLFICSYVFKEVNNQMSKKIDDQIIELANEMVDKFGTDYIIELREIYRILYQKYGTNEGSIIPTDYCYNRVNNGIQIDKKPAVFEYIERGHFRCLGVNYPYNGLIYHKPKQGDEIVVGKCIEGKRIIAPSEDYDLGILNTNKQCNNIEKDYSHKTKREPGMRLRFEVLKRDNFKCCACGASPAKDPSVDLHIDHVIPWSKGGETVLDNLQTLCSACNIGKSDMI